MLNLSPEGRERLRQHYQEAQDTVQICLRRLKDPVTKPANHWYFAQFTEALKEFHRLQVLVCQEEYLR